MAFAPCASCARHVRPDDRSCPFCGAASSAPAEGAGGGAVAGTALLGRAAMVFGAVAVSMSSAACSKESIVAPYGAPPAPSDGGSAIAPAYGGPPEPPDPAPLPLASDAGATKATKKEAK